MMMGGMPDDMIGAIKIKDGLFIGDEFAAQVSPLGFPHNRMYIGLGVRNGEQSQSRDQLLGAAGSQSLGSYRCGLSEVQLA